MAEVPPENFAEVEESLLGNGATGLGFANKGVVMLNGEETYVERVARKDLDSRLMEA